MPAASQQSSRQLTWAFWAFVLALLLVAAELARSYQLGAMQIRVEGNLSPDEREQLDALLDPYVRSSAFWLDTQDLAKDLGSLRWVGAVEVRSTGLSKATVKVSHSLATGLPSPERTLVNAIGDLARAGEQVPVSLVRERLDTDASQKLVFMAFDVMLEELGIHLDEVEIDASGQLALHMDAGKTLMLGSADPVGRASRFARIYRSDLKTNWHQVAYVDARYRDAVAVRTSNQSGLIAGNFSSASTASGEGR